MLSDLYKSMGLKFSNAEYVAQMMIPRVTKEIKQSGLVYEKEGKMVKGFLVAVGRIIEVLGGVRQE